jgi:hypothetical protein
MDISKITTTQKHIYIALIPMFYLIICILVCLMNYYGSISAISLYVTLIPILDSGNRYTRLLDE